MYNNLPITAALHRVMMRPDIILYVAERLSFEAFGKSLSNVPEEDIIAELQKLESYMVGDYERQRDRIANFALHAQRQQMHQNTLIINALTQSIQTLDRLVDSRIINPKTAEDTATQIVQAVKNYMGMVDFYFLQPDQEGGEE
ncbi:MAG: hypothetical protein JXK05_09605 [Campylobacterales bacterium]|nr:hypothetical protein [Campylobacterales bacterium]